MMSEQDVAPASPTMTIVPGECPGAPKRPTPLLRAKNIVTPLALPPPLLPAAARRIEFDDVSAPAEQEENDP
jgi:hypothetical protein